MRREDGDGDRTTRSGDASSTRARADPLDPGDLAPDFRLAGVEGSHVGLYGLASSLDAGPTVVAFASHEAVTATDDLDEFVWFDVQAGTDVRCLSDATFQDARSAVGRREPEVPVLCDPSGAVADRYGVRYDGATALFLVDQSRHVVREWSTPGTLADLDFSAVAAALDDQRVEPDSTTSQP